MLPWFSMVLRIYGMRGRIRRHLSPEWKLDRLVMHDSSRFRWMKGGHGALRLTQFRVAGGNRRRFQGFEKMPAQKCHRCLKLAAWCEHAPSRRGVTVDAVTRGIG